MNKIYKTVKLKSKVIEFGEATTYRWSPCDEGYTYHGRMIRYFLLNSSKLKSEHAIVAVGVIIMEASQLNLVNKRCDIL